MTTSGLTTFGIATEQQSVVDEAYERIGREAGDLGKFFVLGAARTRKTYCVYKGTNLINGKFYIGKCARGVPDRLSQHYTKISLWPNRPLYNAFKKYGFEAFVFSLLAECSSDEEAYQVERRLIQNLKPHYNLQDRGIGRGGYKLTPEQCANVSRGKKASGQRRRDVGVKRTPEQRARIADAQRNLPITAKKTAAAVAAFKIASQKNSKPVWCLETGEFWPSRMSCFVSLGGRGRGYANPLYDCLDKPTRTYKGLHFVSHVA